MKNILKMALTMLLSAAYAITIQSAAYDTAPEIIHAEDDLSILDYTAMVKPQEGADCGLHGIKNSIALFNYLTNTIDAAERDRQLQSNTLGNLGTMSTCRRIIKIPSRELDPEELTSLAKQLTSPYNLPFQNRKLVILDNLLNPNINRTSEQNYQLAEIVENLKNGTPFVHAFLLGNMDESGLRSGHWIAGVIERKEIAGPITLHMANSSATYVHSSAEARQAIFNYDKTIGQQLMLHLQQLNAAEIRLKAIKFLQNELNRNLPENNDSEPNYEAALINIRDIIDEAIQHNILTQDTFEHEYRPLLQAALTQIQNDFLTENQRELKEYLETFLNNTYSSTAWAPPTIIEPTTETTPIAASSQGLGIIELLKSTFFNWWNRKPISPVETPIPETSDAQLAEQLALAETLTNPAGQAASSSTQTTPSLSETSDAQLAEQLALAEEEEFKRLKADEQAAMAHQLETYDSDVENRTTEADAELARALAEITD